MNHLLRELAPISPDAWEEIEEEARRTLKVTLAARKLVDFVGPLGWHASAVDIGRQDALGEPPNDGVEAQLRRALLLVEFRAAFELQRSELNAIERGAKDADLDPVIEAARRMAIAEDRAVFHGYAGAQIEGICEAADENLTLSSDYEKYPGVVVEALGRLRNAGVDGPYGIALGPRCFAGLTRTTSRGGYPVLDHVRHLIDGPLVWAPGVDGAVVMSLRGGDFELTVGQDFSVGYLDHSTTVVRFYLEESFTFRTLSPEAAVPLVYAEPA